MGRKTYLYGAYVVWIQGYKKANQKVILIQSLTQCYKLCYGIAPGALETKTKGHECSMAFWWTQGGGDGRESILEEVTFGLYVPSTIDSGPGVATYPGAPFNQNNC